MNHEIAYIRQAYKNEAKTFLKVCIYFIVLASFNHRM